MRRILRTLPVLLAAVIATAAVQARAADTTMGRMEQGMEGQKNECLLVAMNCGNQVDSIQQRIDRIRGEISKGTAVYTTEELRQLKNQLEDANRTLEFIETSGGV